MSKLLILCMLILPLFAKELNFGKYDGSLKISPNEQVDFLSHLVRNDLPFSPRAMNTAKDIITLQKHEDYQLAGKTGSCGGIGWFVGFLKQNNKTEVFAFNIKGDGANGTEAKKIALEYLK